jgi:phosphoglucomutase
MYAIILAGGSGTRLWPLSREQFPKQYLPLVPVSDDSSDSTLSPMRSKDDLTPSPLSGESRGEGEGDSKFISLFQATIKRVAAGVPPEKIVVVTHRDQAVEIRRQLAQVGITGIRLLEEPEARNTAPAVGLAARFILQEAGPDEIMAVLPSDHLIPDQQAFTDLLKDGSAAAVSSGLVTFGIKPAYPETGYGYIRYGDQLSDKAYKVEKFVEKPDLETAKSYLADSRYLWNSGMFAFRVGALLEEYQRHLPDMSVALERIDFKDLADLPGIYASLEKISIDYGILERATSVAVIPTGIRWNDLGSWEAYYQVSPQDADGNYLQGNVLAVDTRESLIISQSRLTGAIGLKDLVVIDTPDALLVCDRNRTQDVKTIAERLKEAGALEAREHRTVYRPWGSYTSLELGENYQVKRINVNPGSRLSLQSHKHRAENWVVVEGEALVTINDDQVVVKKGESAYIPRGGRHRMENRGPVEMVLIEVQYGDYLGEDDIERYEDDYGRTDQKSTAPINTEEENSPSPLRGEDRGGGENPSNPQPPSSNFQAGGGGEVSPEALAHYNRWLSQPKLDLQMKEELLAMQDDPALIENHFGRELVFGTGGMRGIIGPGLNRINSYIVCRATQGLADYINSLPEVKQNSLSRPQQVAIAYDTRLHSRDYAESAAMVLAANGIKALLFSDIRPTPLLSYATRTLGCAAGIVITASHNPPEYNGYKVYGPDGGQAVSPLVDDVIAAIKPVDIFSGVKRIAKEEAIKKGLFEIIDPVHEQSYLDEVKALSLSDPEQCLKVVFTPLHGTGSVFIPELLRQTRCIDLYLVNEQMTRDHHFSTVKVPNPEDPAALAMVLKLAEETGAELVLATDPDCDRVGTAVRDSDGRYIILSGNQMGALLINYICSRHRDRGTMPADPVLVKTIVTGDLGRRVAESYGLKTVETLTGFKFIGDQIKEFEAKGYPHFIFGYEESCGYLTGTFVRDKDAVIASFMIAEMAAYYKDQNLNLLQVLEQIQQKVGYYRDELLTVALDDISQADRHVAVFENLPRQFAGQNIAEKRDYGKGKGLNFKGGSEFDLTLPRSPVLHYTLEDGSWFAVRPSGTEPKVKFYLSVCASTAEAADQKMTRLREALLAMKV